MRNGREALVALAAIASVAGCSGGGSDSAGTGPITVSLMDRPIDDLTALFVTISGISIKPQGDGPALPLEMVSSPITVNLLELDDENASVLVDGQVIDAGTYNWIEFQIEDTDISESYAMTVSGGMEHVDVDVPSGRIRIVSGFEVQENFGLRILFDWDVRKGLTEAVGQNRYLLRPAFRVLDVDEIGVIEGTVSSNDTILVEPSCAAVVNPEDGGKVVYVFEGDVMPDDIDGDDGDPVTTVDAEFDPATGDYRYRAVVMPGLYTVAFTCEGALDTDAASEDLVFLGAVAVDVPAGSSAPPVDF